MATIIVHGPAACGKSRFAKQIAARFDIDPAMIEDDWNSRKPVREGYLHLTSEPFQRDRFHGAQVVAFDTLGLG